MPTITTSHAPAKTATGIPNADRIGNRLRSSGIGLQATRPVRRP